MPPSRYSVDPDEAYYKQIEADAYNERMRRESLRAEQEYTEARHAAVSLQSRTVPRTFRTRQTMRSGRR